MQPTIEVPELAQLVETSGLEKSKQNQIAEMLGVFFNKASEWDATIKSIVITDPSEVGKMKMAKEGRITLKNMRLDAEKLVSAKRLVLKTAMADFVLEDKILLKGGQMIDITFKHLEQQLEQKEKFAEIWEASRKEKLKSERLEVLIPLGFQYENGFNLGEMDEAMFNSLKLGLEAAKKAAEQAEIDRFAAERAEAAERERIRLENEALKQRAAAREKEIEAERANAETERLKTAAIAKAAQDKQDALMEAQRKQLAAEKAAREKAEQEIQAAKVAKDKADKEAAMLAENQRIATSAAEERASKAPDKDKLMGWVNASTLGGIPTVGKEAEIVGTQIETKFNAFKAWALGQIETI